jgi:hypothetical protein
MNHSQLSTLVVNDDQDDDYVTHAIVADVYADQIVLTGSPRTASPSRRF